MCARVCVCLHVYASVCVNNSAVQTLLAFRTAACGHNLCGVDLRLTCLARSSPGTLPLPAPLRLPFVFLLVGL